MTNSSQSTYLPYPIIRELSETIGSFRDEITSDDPLPVILAAPATSPPPVTQITDVSQETLDEQ